MSATVRALPASRVLRVWAKRGFSEEAMKRIWRSPGGVGVRTRRTSVFRPWIVLPANVRSRTSPNGSSPMTAMTKVGPSDLSSGHLTNLAKL